MRKGVAFTLVGTGVALVLASGTLNGAILSDLLTPGSTITIGDKVFGDFYFSTTCPVPASSITADAIQYGPLHYALVFGAGFLAPPGDVCDIRLGYSVTITSPGYYFETVSLSVVPNPFGGTGAISVSEGLYKTGFGMDMVGFMNVSLTDMADPPPEATDDILIHEWVSPPGEWLEVNKLWAFKDVMLVGGDKGVGLSIITQDYLQAIPEPAEVGTITLLAAGLGAFLLRRRA
jgi:hypothetical protein